MSRAFSVVQLKRDAKRLSRDQSIPLSQALDRLAADYGFKNWSLLSMAESAASPARRPPARAAAFARRPVYFLHGDEAEGDPGFYYCALCDLHHPASHFAQQHTQKENVDQLLTGLSDWEFRAQSGYRRSRGTNILDRAQQVHRTSEQTQNGARSAFHRWLVSQAERHDPIGDLAIDVEYDKAFPVAETSLDYLLIYLAGMGSDAEVITALRDAHREFSELI